MSISTIGHQIIWLQEVDSTNQYASRYAREASSHGLIVATHHQTEGKGQRGNTWESSPGKNLLFSLVLRPTFLQVQKQFLISKATALAVCDMLITLASGVSIKWPNDIYIDNCKVAGILIENSFSTSVIDSTIVGVGINVNQNDFPDDIPNPTSLLIATGIEYNVEHLLKSFCSFFENRYQMLERRMVDTITNDYKNLLYRKDEFHLYRAKENTFKAKIFGVRDSGELILETEEGELLEFDFKEVSYVIN